jgi:ATP-dependent RNA helicase RhlE
VTTPTFASLGLSEEMTAALADAGYEAPRPIQASAIPPALAGKDVIGCAATGTGKTAAFVLPMVERLAGKKGTRGLVLAPTRELAEQTMTYLERFGGPRKVNAALVIGGMGMGRQVDALQRKPSVIIATPGRLVDHLQEGTANLTGIELLVLDEADRMLDMGFRPQLDQILKRLPKPRQSLLFSATMASEVKTFAAAHLVAPVKVEVNVSGTTAARATQAVYLVPQEDKVPLLMALLAEGEESTLVFTRTKRRADRVAKAVQRAGHTTDRIHADRSQGQRRAALDGFKQGKFRVLVATDIAARGIDVEDIGHVVNFDLPHVPADYVHRIGRTARNLASGHASSFAAPDEVKLLKDIEKFTQKPVPRRTVPASAPAFVEARARQAAAPPLRPGSSRPASRPGQRHHQRREKR